MLVPPGSLIGWFVLYAFILCNAIYYLYKMKAVTLFIGLLILFASCNRPNTKIKERISNSDSVAINYFKGDGTMDTVAVVKIVKDKKTMAQLAELISSNAADTVAKCGYDGSLHFFKKNRVVQDIDFRMNDVNCMFFIFTQQGESVATKLSPEAKQLLESIKK
jgi:hypothetical protein